MKLKTLWWITATLALAYFGIYYFFLYQYDVSGLADLALVATDLLANLLLILMLGIVPAALSALIPYKDRKYKQKLKWLFPTWLVAGLVLLICANAYELSYNKEKGIGAKRRISFDQVKVPPGLDCKAFHEGRFETKGMYIERSGNSQSQTDKETGKTDEFIVVWPNDCEYHFLSMKDSSLLVKIKITQVRNDGYDCYVSDVQSPRESGYFVTVRKEEAQ